jgi:hypothetical protein
MNQRRSTTATAGAGAPRTAGLVRRGSKAGGGPVRPHAASPPLEGRETPEPAVGEYSGAVKLAILFGGAALAWIVAIGGFRLLYVWLR